MDLGLQILKTNVAIRISILQIWCAPILRQNGQLKIFRPILPKYWIFRSEFQKFKFRFGISTTKIPPVPIFSQNGQLRTFWPKFWEIAQLCRIILVLITLRVLQRAGWRWMELGGQFSNTLIKFCCKAISWRFIICFRILWFHVNLMISSKDISTSQRLKCSLDIFFMLGILLRCVFFLEYSKSKFLNFEKIHFFV